MVLKGNTSKGNISSYPEKGGRTGKKRASASGKRRIIWVEQNRNLNVAIPRKSPARKPGR